MDEDHGLFIFINFFVKCINTGTILRNGEQLFPFLHPGHWWQIEAHKSHGCFVDDSADGLLNWFEVWDTFREEIRVLDEVVASDLDVFQVFAEFLFKVCRGFSFLDNWHVLKEVLLESSVKSITRRANGLILTNVLLQEVIVIEFGAGEGGVLISGV